MPCAHPGQGQQLCSFFSALAVSLRLATCGKEGLLEALVLTPRPGLGSCGLLRGQSLWDLHRRCVVRVNTVSGQVNSDGILTGRQWKRKSGVERAFDLAAAEQSWFYKKCSHRKYLRIAMCKQDWCWWEQGLARTDIKQYGAVLTLAEECYLY